MTEREIDPALDPSLDQVSRRSFLEKMGMSTFAAAILGKEALAQDAPGSALKDPNLAHADVSFESAGQRVQAFECRPRAEGKRGGAIVIHEIFGLNDHIRDIACRLARAGFDALAINFFTREGNPPDGSGGFDNLMQFVGKIPDSQVVGDIKAGADWLRAQRDSNGKVGVVGFCWGGYFSMLADGSLPNLDAAVAYYGRIRLAEKSANKPNAPFDLVDKMNAPLLGHFGAEDRSIPKVDADALRDALKEHGKTGEIYVYEGAGHAFNNDTRPSYNADAAKLAWSRTLAWFDRYLKSA